MKTGFLFNHYLTYQVPHGAPVAFALSRIRPDFHIELLFSTVEARSAAQRIATLYPGHRCRFQLLQRGSIVDSAVTRFPFLHRPLTLMENRKLLASFNVLVAPEKNSLVLKALPAFRSVKFISLHHGRMEGSRPRSFNKGRLKFDCVLVHNPSDYERCKDEYPEGYCEVIGYPKFEVLQQLKPEAPALFNNERKTVLYAPHFHRKQSSWLSMGRKILAFFKQRDEYNLIFAPHVRLFRHRRYHGNIDLDDFRAAPNILIDTGSERSIDMSYTRAADVYLGDVSSQVWEFVSHRPRPCVFLNAAGFDPSIIGFWKLGPVIDKVDQLEPALAMAQRDFDEKFRHEQDDYIGAAATTDDRPPSTRGAEAIVRFLQSP